MVILVVMVFVVLGCGGGKLEGTRNLGTNGLDIDITILGIVDVGIDQKEIVDENVPSDGLGIFVDSLIRGFLGDAIPHGVEFCLNGVSHGLEFGDAFAFDLLHELRWGKILGGHCGDVVALVNVDGL
jgi:hypothetical protein